MNNLKKLGLTALAGSLAAVTAQAGEMTVTGALQATYSTQDGSTGTIATDHGVGLGNDKDFQVSGSGELDNGFTFSGYTLLKDTIVVSSSSLTLTMGSLGSVSVGSGTGGASTSFDVQTPTAYEEVDDGGATSLSANFVGSWADNNSLIYTSPSFDLPMGMSATLKAEYSPEATGTSPNDGGTVVSTVFDSGQALGLTLAGNGLTVGAYGSERKRSDNAAKNTDSFQGVWYANYSIGPVSVGYSESYHDMGLTQTSEAAMKSDKAVTTAGGIFETETYSIAFNVNDNLSLSYAKATDTYDDQAHTKTGGTAIDDVDMDMKSIQAAYSMGSMSIKAYRTETNNVAYNTIGGDLTITEVALGLAF
jgi:outer membrane protein OmpU